MSSRATLPPVDELLAISKSIAMLDAILMPDWEYRYYSFNSKWAPGEQMASMRDGSGNGYFILFNRHGAILKSYDHESPAAEHDEPLPGMFDGILPEFADFLNEPAFSINQTTFCCWRKYTDQSWQAGRPSYPAGTGDPSGASSLLAIFAGGPRFYADWASDYYEREIDLDAVKRIFRHEPLDQGLVEALNPERIFEELAADVEEIGYRSC